MDFTEEQVKNLEDVFRQNLPPDKDSLTLTEFKKLMPSKNVGKYHKSVWKSKSFLMEIFLLILLEFEKYLLIYHQVFFVERAFKIFDRDGNGDISLAEFIDTMYQFAGKGQAEKILFLFKVYDIDGMCKHNS